MLCFHSGSLEWNFGRKWCGGWTVNSAASVDRCGFSPSHTFHFTQICQQLKSSGDHCCSFFAILEIIFYCVQRPPSFSVIFVLLIHLKFEHRMISFDFTLQNMNFWNKYRTHSCFFSHYFARLYFYRTQVYLGSDLWVQVSQTDSLSDVWLT